MLDTKTTYSVVNGEQQTRIVDELRTRPPLMLVA